MSPILTTVQLLSPHPVHGPVCYIRPLRLLCSGWTGVGSTWGREPREEAAVTKKMCQPQWVIKCWE